MNGINANNSISAIYPDFDESSELVDLGDGNYRFGMTNIFNLNNVKGVDVQCVENRSKKAIEIEFAVPANWVEYEDIGIKIKIKRDAEWNVNTFHDYTNFFPYSYDVVANGQPTATKLRDAVYNMIYNYQADGRGAVLFDIVKSGTTKLIIIAKTSDFDFEVHNWNASGTITTLSEHEEGVWYGNNWKRFRPIPDLFPGEDLPDYLMRCKSPCLITLQNCVPACDLDEPEQLLMAGKSWNGTVHVWVDGSHEAFEPFLEAIKTAVPNSAAVTYNGCFGNPSVTMKTDHLLIASTGLANSKITVEGLSAAYSINNGSTLAANTNVLASTFSAFKIKKAIIDAMNDDKVLTITYTHNAGIACETKVFKWNKSIGLLSD
ncbi:MAG: hypothetical protein AB8G11_02410 [Saprospiraceae bacterium]